MYNFKNTPADLKIKYGASNYEFIEKIFEIKEGETPILHFLLSLLGYMNNKKVPLDSDDGSEKSHEFSLRTLYPRNEADFDAFIGLVAILDNLDLPYKE